MGKYHIIIENKKTDEFLVVNIAFEDDEHFAQAIKDFKKTKMIYGVGIFDENQEDIILYWYGQVKTLDKAIQDYKIAPEHIPYFEQYGIQNVIYLKDGTIKVVDDKNLPIQEYVSKNKKQFSRIRTTKK